MTGEQIRRRGLRQAVVGAVLVAWVVVFAALTEVGNPPALVAAAVSAGIACLCALGGGVLAGRLADAEVAARWRHVFVVLEGVGAAAFYVFYWSSFSVEPVGEPDGFEPVVVFVLGVPVVVALAFTTRLSRTVHRFVVDACGPLVPGSAAGAAAQRIRVLGSVLVAVGVVLVVAVVAVSLSEAKNQEWYLGTGLVVTLVPVLFGTRLVRVTDVYSARRVMAPGYLGAICAVALPLTAIGFLGSPVAMVFGTLKFGAVMLVVSAVLVMREYTGEWDRPWRERLWGRATR